MTTLLMLLGSTWSPPPQLQAAWSAEGDVDLTLPEYDAICRTRFELRDGRSSLVWEDTLSEASTVSLDSAPPELSFPTDAKLLLTFRVSCTNADGRKGEVTRLPGRVVQLVAGRFVDVEPQNPDGEGTLVVESPVGVWSESAQRPLLDADDDPKADWEVER